jgi:ubiquinone/menaquinone biosynthesis C-methylase UbiE
MNSKIWVRRWEGKTADRFKTNKERNNIVLKMIRGKTILDIGCGRGELMRSMKRRGKEVYGIDFSEKMLKGCKGLNVLQGSAEDLPFKDDMFDCVTAVGLIEYLKVDERLIGEIYRVLKPKGIAIISYRNYDFKYYSKRIFEPERRVHKDSCVGYAGFVRKEIRHFHRHKPLPNQEHNFINYSGFILKLMKR